VEVTYSTVTGALPNDGENSLLLGNLVGTFVPPSQVAIVQGPTNETVGNLFPATFVVSATTDSQVSIGTPGDIRNDINTFLAY